MKKLLIIAPNYFGFHKVITEVFKKYSGYNVEFLEINGNYKYKNWGERIYNFFLKNLTNKNIKKTRIEGNLDYKINSLSYYDIILVNRPDMLTDEQLHKCKNLCQKFAVLYWDSFDKIAGQLKTTKYFDVCFSFENYDCEKHNLLKTNNFYFIEESNINPEYDVFFLGVLDKRYGDLINILRYLKSKNKKVGARLFSYEKHTVPNDLTNEIEIVKVIIPFSEVYKYNINTKIMLDLGHHNQSGLSFRSFEALGLNKKLITTNNNVKNYDFYNENNIFIVENVNNIYIDDDFFTNEFQLISKEIKIKYSAQKWVEKIIKSIENGK